MKSQTCADIHRINYSQPMKRSGPRCTLRLSRADRSERFTVLAAQTGLGVDGLGKLLQVTPRTVRNWLSGHTAIPYAAFKLLRVLRGFELPMPGFEGWCMHSGKLWTPEGRPIEPCDGGWWSLLVRQAACFRLANAQATELRRLVGKMAASDAGAVLHPAAPEARSAQAAAGAGLVSSKTSGPATSSECNHSDTIKTPCKPLLDYLTPSPQPPAAAPSTSESALTLSFALPWTPTCGLRLTSYRLQPGPHLASKPHLKQVLNRSQRRNPESSPEPKNRRSTNGKKPNAKPGSGGSAKPLPGLGQQDPDATNGAGGAP